MKASQKGFTLIEGLLIVIAVSLVTGVGFYVYNANKDVKPSENSSAPSQTQKTNDLTEDQKILKAAACSSSPICKIEHKQTNLADVTAGSQYGGGHIFLAKESNEWKIIWQGNGDVPNETVSKYNIPQDWLGPQE